MNIFCTGFVLLNYRSKAARRDPSLKENSCVDSIKQQTKVIKDAVGQLYNTLARVTTDRDGKSKLEAFKASYDSKVTELETYVKKPGTDDHLKATD